MKRFLSDNHGDVNQKIILLSIIVLIALFFFPKAKDSVRCAQNKTDSGIYHLLTNDEIKESAEACKANGSPANGENNENPNTGNNGGNNNIGGGGTIGGGNGENGNEGNNGSEGGNGEGTGETDEEGKYIPVSYYESSEVELQCKESQAYYKFEIPTQATPQSTGTKSLSITNKKGWDMWMKITDIKTKNGLSIVSSPDKYVPLLNDTKSYFDIKWLWNVPMDYNGSLGEATVYFQTVCNKPNDNDIYNPFPESPKNLIVTSTDNNSISLQWDEAKYATHYQLYNNKGVLVYEGKNTSASNTGLYSGTDYTYTLYALNSKGKSASVTVNGKTTGKPPAPSAPKNIRVVNATETTVTLTWDESDYTDIYYIYRQPYYDIQYYGGKENTATITNLKQGTTYTIGIKATNPYIHSSYTSFTFTTAGATIYPSEPKNFRITNITETTMLLDWDPVPNATSYSVQRVGGPTYSTTGTSYLVTGLTSGTNYTFKLFANNNKGSSEPSQATGRTLGANPMPTSPLNLKFTNITSTSMNLSWDASTNVKTYRIFQDGVVIHEGTTTNFQITKLKPNSPYKFQVAAVNDFGTAYSLVQTAKTNQDVYDDSSDINTSCQDDSITRTYTLPTNLQPGTAGKFSINLTNKSSRNLFVKIESVDTAGGLFEGSNPVFLEYATSSKIISPSSSYEIPITWTFPSKADSSYNGKTGSINVRLTTSCQS